MKVSLSKKIVFVIVSLLLISSFSIFTAKAATTRGAISITFDDGLQTQYDYAFPILNAWGMKATFYVNTARINTANYMNTWELQTLQNYGHEIASHSNNHVEFPSISGSQIVQECQTSQNTLRSWGLTAKNFAYPDAARNAYTDSIVAQYYRSARWGYVGPFVMSYPTSQFLLPAIDGSVTLSNDFSLVDQISAANGWGIIVFHDVSPAAGIWQNHIDTTNLQTFLNYVQAKGVAVLTVDQALNSVSTPAPTPTPTPTPISTPTPTPAPTPPGSSATFGTTSVGGSSTTLYTAIPRATQYTPTNSGTVTDIMLYLTGTGHAQAAIYADGGNVPGALLAKSSSDTITSNGWHDFTGFNTAITAGTAYWLACETDSGNLLWYYNSGGANYYQGTSGSYGTFPNPYTRGNFGNYQTSIYAIYTNTNSPPTPTPTPTPSPSPSGSSDTFGTTTVGGSSTTLYTAIPRATQYTPTNSGTVTDIMLYLTGSGHAQVAIYADGGNVPGALLAKSSSDTITSNGWHDFTGFNTAITAGTAYWLACETDSGNLLWYYNSGGANYYQGTSGSYGTFPNPYTRGNFGNYQTSIYAIYH